MGNQKKLATRELGERRRAPYTVHGVQVASRSRTEPEGSRVSASSRTLGTPERLVHGNKGVGMSGPVRIFKNRKQKNNVNSTRRAAIRESHQPRHAAHGTRDGARACGPVGVTKSSHTPGPTRAPATAVSLEPSLDTLV